MNLDPCRPAVITRWYGQWQISEQVDDAVAAVMDAYDAGATRIEVAYLDEIMGEVPGHREGRVTTTVGGEASPTFTTGPIA